MTHPAHSTALNGWRAKVPIAIVVVLCIIASATRAGRGEAVEIPPGTTQLSRIGIYEVSYQSYGEDSVSMPAGWSGHFEPTSGISYAPNRHANGRDAILMHSPWHVGPGRTWVDYRLRLPEETPVTLAFGIAMHEERAEKSDGVTFGASVIHNGERRTLLEEHYNSPEWKDLDYDLSTYAGETVTLRLQVEPGPDNNSAFDFSYFSRARIVAGTDGQGAKRRLEAFTNRAAYRAVQDCSLRGVSNEPDRGVVPSNLLSTDDYSNNVQARGDRYLFTYSGSDCSLTYVFEPETGTLDDITARLNGNEPFKPASGGGVVPVDSDGSAAHGEVLNVTLHEAEGTVTTVCRYKGPDGPFNVTWTFGIDGKALTVEVTANEPDVKSLLLGQAVAGLRENYRMSYLQAPVTYLPQQKAFAYRMLNWKETGASVCRNSRSLYHETTAGDRHPLSDRGYIAVSPSLREVLPNIPQEPSRYLDKLAPKIVLDVWAHHAGTYEGDARLLRKLKDAGVDHMAVIEHKWQRYGYDVKLPDHYPANPEWGGHEQMKKLGRTARELGYPLALHENYIDLYPDAPSYNPEARSLKADGSPQLAWLNEGTGVQSFGLSKNYAVGYARENSPKIHDAYNTTAAYLDVHTCTAPWVHLDHDADEPMPARARRGVKYYTELFEFEQKAHGGPLFGEGGTHFYWAGPCDAVEAELRGRDRREHHVPMPEFDLLKIHPQMVNHGMGYYSRWYEKGYSKSMGVTAGAPRQIDNYRAQQIAYGHAGFVGTEATSNVQWVAKEHHLMHPVQELYGASIVETVDYYVQGRYVSAGAALVAGERSRQRIRYGSGLTVWVNFAEENWEVGGRSLPQFGWLARGPGVEAWTGLVDDKYADYAECADYVFADARTAFTMPYRREGTAIQPGLKEMSHLGGNRVRLTYRWDVDEDVNRNYHCFVHFTRPEDTDAIEFQQDHALPKPTGQWKKGELIEDGPHTVAIPQDGQSAYDIFIGLYDRDDGDRALLRGPRAGRKAKLGTLRVTRQDGDVTDVRLESVETAPADRPADFSAHMNPEGTTVDFGAVVTNGSVKVEKGGDTLTVIPYPMGRDFSVALDLARLAPDADLSDLEISAQEELSQRELGSVDYRIRDSRLRFTVGMPDARRYVISW